MKLAELALEPVLHVCRNMREWDRREIHAGRWNDSDEGFAHELMGYAGRHSRGPSRFAWVAGLEDRPIALVGCNEIWPGAWSAMMVATEEFPLVGLQLTKFVRHAMIPTLKAHGAHRCEARSMEGHVEAHRWLKILGATPEATLKRYGKGGEDFTVFRWDNV